MKLGVLDVVGIVFVILKFVGVITWPWLWVLSPWWISIIIALIVLICAN